MVMMSICHDVQFWFGFTFLWMVPIPQGPAIPRLPVPGYEVVLPQNATAEIYQEVLKEMKLNEARGVIITTPVGHLKLVV